MKSYSEFITAGQPLRLTIPGRMLYIQRSAGGPVLDVEFMRNQAGSQTIERVGKGFKAAPVGGFEGIRISARVSGVVDFVITDGDIAIAFDEDMTTIGNDDGQAIPMRTVPGKPLDVLFAGTVSPVFGVATVDNTDAEAIPVQQKTGAVFNTRGYLAAVVTDYDPVAVGEVRTLLVGADSARRGARFKNTGDNPFALGGAGVTFANAALVIQPGETWNENEAPGAAWYCICAAAAASTINIQTIA